MEILPTIFQNQGSISQKATSGIVWMALREIGFQLLLLIKLLLVANLLGPTIYGIFGITLIIILLSEQLSQFGIDYALIHHQNKETFYDTAWTINVLRGILLFVLIIALQSPLVELFSIQGFESVLLVISVTLILEGFVNIGSIEFRRELDYQKEFLFRFVPDLMNIITTILLLFIFQNIWSLVIGLIFERISRLILSYIMHSYRPKFTIKISQIKILGVYGWSFFLTGILGYLLIQGPEVYIGIFLGVTALAFFQISYKLTTLPVTSLATLFNSVSIPVYAKIQRNPVSSANTFLIVLYTQFLIYSVYSSVFYVITTPFSLILLGNEWSGVAVLMRILLIFGFTLIGITAINAIFVAMGQQSKLIKWQFLIFVLFILLVIPVIRMFNVSGISWLLVGTFTILNVGYAFELQKQVEVKLNNVLKEIIKIFTIGVITSISLSILTDYILIFAIHSIIGLSLMGVLCFMLFTLVMHKTIGIELIDLVNHQISKLVPDDR